MWSDQDGLEHRVPVVCGLGQSNLVNVQFACGRRFRVLNVVDDVTLECSAKQPIKLLNRPVGFAGKRLLTLRQKMLREYHDAPLRAASCALKLPSGNQSSRPLLITVIKSGM